MSVKDLIANWEEALAVALSQSDERDIMELDDGGLEHVADRRLAAIRSGLRAGPVLATKYDGNPYCLCCD